MFIHLNHGVYSMYYGLSVFAIIGSLFAAIISFFTGILLCNLTGKSSFSADDNNSKLHHSIQHAKYPGAIVFALFAAINTWFQVNVGYANPPDSQLMFASIVLVKILLISLLLLLVIGVSTVAGSYIMLELRDTQQNI